MKLIDSAIEVLMEELKPKEMLAIYRMATGTTRSENFKNSDLLRIIHVLCNKLGWVQEESNGLVGLDSGDEVHSNSEVAISESRMKSEKSETEIRPKKIPIKRNNRSYKDVCQILSKEQTNQPTNLQYNGSKKAKKPRMRGPKKEQENIKTKREKKSTKILTCDLCTKGFNFKNRSSLKRHRNLIHGANNISGLVTNTTFLLFSVLLVKKSLDAIREDIVLVCLSSISPSSRFLNSEGSRS